MTGRSTSVYLIPFGELKQVVGSRDPALLKAITAERADMLADADELRADGDELTCAEALGRLIEGEGYSDDDSVAYLYGYALEVLCDYLGEFAETVDNRSEIIDPYFARCGVPLKFRDLVFGDEVIRPGLPYAGDPPHIGSWSPEAVSHALAPLFAIDLEALRAEEKILAKSVGSIRTWVKTTAHRRGWGIIGFSV
jgi:hypothetical protein